MNILKSPIISEKSSMLAASRKYVFVVSTDTNKLEIKRSVTALYGVTVTAVNIVHIPAKEVRRGRHVGWKPGYKKAVVTLAAGQKIELV